MKQTAQRVAVLARKMLRESDDLERTGRPPLLILSRDERTRLETDIARLLGQEPFADPALGREDYDGA
ncbi:MAG TPA: hypothetical protein VKE73_07795 [Myxococcota bacterium]|nr:hypothetical protein [Myxococcota bacterium]